MYTNLIDHIKQNDFERFRSDFSVFTLEERSIPDFQDQVRNLLSFCINCGAVEFAEYLLENQVARNFRTFEYRGESGRAALERLIDHTIASSLLEPGQGQMMSGTYNGLPRGLAMVQMLKSKSDLFYNSIIEKVITEDRPDGLDLRNVRLGRDSQAHQRRVNQFYGEMLDGLPERAVGHEDVAGEVVDIHADRSR